MLFLTGSPKLSTDGSARLCYGTVHGQFFSSTQTPRVKPIGLWCKEIRIVMVYQVDEQHQESHDCKVMTNRLKYHIRLKQRLRWKNIISQVKEILGSRINFIPLKWLLSFQQNVKKTLTVSYILVKRRYLYKCGPAPLELSGGRLWNFKLAICICRLAAEILGTFYWSSHVGNLVLLQRSVAFRGFKVIKV